MSIGKKLISSFINTNEFSLYVKLRLSEALFREGELELFHMVNNHALKFGKFPSPNTIEQYGLADDLLPTDEPPMFYLQEAERRYLRSSMKSMMMSINELLMDEEDDKAYHEIISRVGEMTIEQNKNMLFDYRESWGMVKDAYTMAHGGNDAYALSFGWPRLDRMTGGLGDGDLCTIVGRPAAGKTFKMLYLARNSWKKGRRPLLVSLEMNAKLIMQRLGAMDAHVNLTNLMKGQLSTASLTKLKAKMESARNNTSPFWVVDGNMTQTPEDVIMLAKQLGATDVYIDAAYLLKNKDKRMNKWDRMSENAETVKKGLAQGCGLPVVASYQFSKDSKKKAKDKGVKEDMGMEDIYGSDAIAQLSSVILGLTEPESVSTQMERLIKILKGRSGETGQFRINWDFNKMDFSQILESEDYVYLKEKEPPKDENLNYV